MELVYLWVEKYKNIEKQGFQFSPNFDVKFTPIYEGETLSDKSELIITPKENPLKDFFGTNINVTAIVGENGSGKSTLLELISFLRLERIDKLTDKKVLLVFKNKNILYIMCVANAYHSFSCNIKIINKSSYNYEKENIHTSKLFELTLFTNGLADFTMQDNYGLMRTAHFDSFYNGYHIHHKTKYDEQKKHEDFCSKYAYLLNISNNLFEEISSSFIFRKMKIELDLSKRIALITNDEYEQSLRKIDLYYNPILSIEKIYHDNSSDIGLQKDAKNELISKFISFYFLNKYIDLVNRFQFDMDKRFIKDYKEEYLKDILQTLTKKDKLVSNPYIYILNITKKYYNDIDTVIKSKFKGKNGMLNDYILYTKQLKYIKRFNSLISIVYSNFESTDIDKDDFVLTKNCEEIEEKKINKFNYKVSHSVLVKDLYNSQFLRVDFYNINKDYNYRKLSTGEKQFLDFIVNFTYTLVQMSYTDKSVILMDEIDITMHPNWQKKLLSTVYKIFEQLSLVKAIRDNMKYHLICTTHSPFILSDLPKENVIFLEKGEQVYPFENGQTFGANIHTLLSHGFFMSDGLMGEFAKGKINDVYNFLIGEQSKVKTKQEAQNIINIVGEPLIKKQLQKLFDDRFDRNNLTLDKEIELLEKKLEALRKLKK